MTVGPLDRDDDDLRLNWFLYRVAPNAALPEHGAAAHRLADVAGPAAARAAALLPPDRVPRVVHERRRPGAVRPRRAGRRDAGAPRERDHRRGRPAALATRAAARRAAARSRWTSSISSRSRSSGPPSRSRCDSRSATRSASSSSTRPRRTWPGRRCGSRGIVVAPSMGPRLVSVDAGAGRARRSSCTVVVEGLTSRYRVHARARVRRPAGPRATGR